MQPSSSAFATAITQNNQLMCAKAEIWSSPPNPQLLYGPLELDAGSGDVTDDETAITRRTATCTVLDPTGDLTPSDAGDLLHPMSGNEIRLFRGLLLPTGPEYIPLGVFRNHNPDVVNRANGGMTAALDLADRMQPFSTYGWINPFTVQGDITQIIYSTLDGFMPGLEYNFDISGYEVNEVPSLVWGGIGAYAAARNQSAGEGATDPASGITDLATCAGWEVFFDAQGTATFRTITVPATRAPQFSWEEGPGCTAEAPHRGYDLSNWYNTVVVQGGTASIASNVQAVVYLPPKPNPCIPYSYTSPSITTESQGYSCGLGILYRLQFALEAVKVTMAPDPRVNSGDTARLNFPSSRIQGIYAIENVKMPLYAKGKMECKCRPVALTGMATFGLPAEY